MDFSMTAISDCIQAHEPRLKTRLRELVEVESPSEDKPGVDRAGALVAAWAEELGGKTRRFRQKEFGDVLERPRAGEPGHVVSRYRRPSWVIRVSWDSTVRSRAPAGRRGRPRRASRSISSASNRLVLPSALRCRVSVPRLTYAYRVAGLTPSRRAASAALTEWDTKSILITSGHRVNSRCRAAATGG